MIAAYLCLGETAEGVRVLRVVHPRLLFVAMPRRRMVAMLSFMMLIGEEDVRK